MRKVIKIEINCGETSCAANKGEFCEHFGTMRFGTIPLCRLFASDGDSHTELMEVGGWIQRCHACLSATK